MESFGLRCVSQPRARSSRLRSIVAHWITSRRFEIVLTANHIAPIVALVAGILILIVPWLLNFIIAIYLIVVDLSDSTAFTISSGGIA